MAVPNKPTEGSSWPLIDVSVEIEMKLKIQTEVAQLLAAKVYIRRNHMVPCPLLQELGRSDRDAFAPQVLTSCFHELAFKTMDCLTQLIIFYFRLQKLHLLAFTN